MNITAVLTRRCNIKCDHCYLPAINYSPGMKDDLSEEDFNKSVKAMSLFSHEVDEIYVTGGEFLLLSYGRNIIKVFKEMFPSSKVFAYTNGKVFLDNPSLFNDVKPDYFHLGIDLWHQGVNTDGVSLIAEKFIDRMITAKNFSLIFHWTAMNNERDASLYEKFYQKYGNKYDNLTIEYKPVSLSATRCSTKDIEPAYKKAASWRECTYADHILTRDKMYYCCHWAIKASVLGTFDNVDLVKEVYKTRQSNLAKLLHSDKCNDFFEYLRNKYSFPKATGKCMMCEGLEKKGVGLINEANTYVTR